MGKGELEISESTEKKILFYILKQILGHFLWHSNSEIKWVSKRNNSRLFLWRKRSVNPYPFPRVQGSNWRLPLLFAFCRRPRLFAWAHRAGMLWRLFVQYLPLGKANLWYSSITVLYKRPLGELCWTCTMNGLNKYYYLNFINRTRTDNSDFQTEGNSATAECKFKLNQKNCCSSLQFCLSFFFFF